ARKLLPLHPQHSNACGTGGQFGSFRDVRLASTRPATFVDTIHMARQPLWFRGSSPADQRPAGDPQQPLLHRMSKLFQNPRSRRDVDVNYFWWDNHQPCKTACPSSARSWRHTRQPWGDNQFDQSSTYRMRVSAATLCRNPDGEREALVLVTTRTTSLLLQPQASARDELPAAAGGTPMTRVCDGFVDCVGKEDEDEAFCRNCVRRLADCDLGDDETEEACMRRQGPGRGGALANEFQMTAGNRRVERPRRRQAGDLLQAKTLVPVCQAPRDRLGAVLLQELHLYPDREQRFQSKCFLLGKRITEPGPIRGCSTSAASSADDGLNAAMADQQLGYPGHERFILNAWQQFGRGTGGFILSGVHCGPGGPRTSRTAPTGRGATAAPAASRMWPAHLLDRQALQHARGPLRQSLLSFVENVRRCPRLLGRLDETECDILNVTLALHNRTAGCVVEISPRRHPGVVWSTITSTDEEGRWSSCRKPMGIPGRGALGTARAIQPHSTLAGVCGMQDIRSHAERHGASLSTAQPQRLRRVHLLDDAGSCKLLCGLLRYAAKRLGPLQLLTDIRVAAASGITECHGRSHQEEGDPARRTAQDIKLPTQLCLRAAATSVDRDSVRAHCFPYAS
uniref:DUF3506 domain-containing protein n=1 Tax=Macrostomum lignano TaxID=282301 RepID=A0A1I8FB91_9PLAT